MRRPFGILCCCALIAAVAEPLWAPVERPQAARRTVRVFDFEERDVNLDPLPMHWFRAIHDPPARDRPGFPPWNESRFDDSAHTSGNWSVLLPARGGSTSLRLASGVLAAIPGADYEIAAHMRTDGLERSRAFLVARLLDDRGEPILESETRSEPIHTGGEWRRVAIQLEGRFDEAAWIQIDLELLQPAQWRDASVESALLEDFNARAWFDDVVIRQVPKSSIRLATGDIVVEAPRRPELVMAARDLTGERLVGRVRVADVDGRLVDSWQGPLSNGGRAARWTPDMQTYGWRRAVFDVLAEGSLISRRTLDFVWAPARAHQSKGATGRFELIAEDVSRDAAARLADAARAIGAGAVRLAATALTGPDSSPARAALDDLLAQGASVSIALTDAPTREMSAGSVAFDQESADWRAAIEPLISKYGQRVHRWALGDSAAFDSAERTDIAQDAQALRQFLLARAPSPEVIVPWLSARQVPPDLKQELALTIPVETQHPAIPLVPRTLEEGQPYRLFMQTIDHDAIRPRAAAADAVKRLVQAWRTDALAIGFRAPWRETEARLAPTPMLAAIRQTIERLAGREIVSALPLTNGVTALVLSGPTSDAIVAWNDAADPSAAVVEGYLTEGPVTVHDIFGNKRTVPLEDGRHRVPLTSEPVFIEGVDVDLARFRAGFRVEPSFLPSTAERHRIEIVLENPWDDAISGRLRFVEPKHWSMSPKVRSFSAPAGQTVRLPFETSFGVGEEAGQARVAVDVELQADKRYPRIRLDGQIDIGLPHVQMTASHHLTTSPAGDGDLVVTVVITNTGSRPISLTAFASAPDFARQSIPVSDLPPTESTVKRFIFDGAGALPEGARVRTGLIEASGLGRLNKTLVVE